VALIFWVIGVWVQAFKPSKDASSVFFLFFLITATFLITGPLSTIGPAWISMLLSFLLWVIGPLFVHFHFNFPNSLSIRGQPMFLIGLYGVGIVFGLLYAYLGHIETGSIWANQLLYGSRIYLILCLVVVIGLLFYSYRHASTAGVRSKIRIVLWEVY
jgi:hypothetical protein